MKKVLIILVVLALSLAPVFANVSVPLSFDLQAGYGVNRTSYQTKVSGTGALVDGVKFTAHGIVIGANATIGVVDTVNIEVGGNYLFALGENQGVYDGSKWNNSGNMKINRSNQFRDAFTLKLGASFDFDLAPNNLLQLRTGMYWNRAYVYEYLGKAVVPGSFRINTIGTYLGISDKFFLCDNVALSISLDGQYAPFGVGRIYSSENKWEKMDYKLIGTKVKLTNFAVSASVGAEIKF